jgi:hypothetical protein
MILAIAYAKGYNKLPESLDPDYNINLIPSFTSNYGYLAGASFTIPISVVGIFMVINRAGMQKLNTYYRVLYLMSSIERQW